MGKDDSPTVVFLKDFTAGQFGGMAQVIVGHPLDTIKVVMQTQPNPPIYTSATHCFKSILATEGAFGFFKGMLSPLFVVGAINACLFAFYGATQKAILKTYNITEKEMSFGQTALCGAVAGVACAPLSGPMELIKSQLQVQRGRADAKYMGTFKFTNHLVRLHGVGALTRGLGATIVREAPAYAMFYGVYFTVKRKLIAANPNASSFSVQVPAACLAGLGYWTSCYPIDVAKSVMQTEPLGKLPYKHKNVFSTMSYIFRNEGVAGLFRGIGPCYLRALPAGTATFVTYEAVLKALG